MSATNYATLCTEDLKTKIRALSAVGNKVLDVYTGEELSEKTFAIKLPAVGIVYEGIRPVAANNQINASSELVCSLVVLAEKPKGATGVAKTQVTSMSLLDDLRTAILGTRSPTGHFWKFSLEAPAGEVKSQMLWLQRWSTAIQLVSRPA